MALYYVNDNPQSNGDHEVHTTGCSWLPNPENRTSLGSFTSCHMAVVKARQFHSKVNGCYYCSKACHTT